MRSRRVRPVSGRFGNVSPRGGGIVPRRRPRRNLGVFTASLTGSTYREGGALPAPLFLTKARRKSKPARNFLGVFGCLTKTPVLAPVVRFAAASGSGRGIYRRRGDRAKYGRLLRFADFAQWSAGACALCVRVGNPDKMDTQRAPACIMRARWNPSGVGDQSPPRFAYSEFSEMNRRGAGDPAQNRPCNALYGRFCVQKSPFPLIFDEMPGKRGNL